MFERFTDRARKVLHLANVAGCKYRTPNGDCNTSHILIGLFEEGGGVAAHVLRNLGITKEKIVSSCILESHVGRTPLAKLPHSVEATEALARAVEVHKELGHNYIGTEHILLGLIEHNNNSAVRTLQDIGFSTEAIRDEILSMVAPQHLEFLRHEAHVAANNAIGHACEIRHWENRPNGFRYITERITELGAAAEKEQSDACKTMDRVWNELIVNNFSEIMMERLLHEYRDKASRRESVPG